MMSSERQAFNDGFDKGFNKALDKIAQLEAENEALREAFSHIHVNNQEDDACKECGLDLRHPVHRGER